MDQSPTIRIESIEGYSALKMIWERDAASADVSPAFSKIREKLETNDRPLTVIVDLSRNPKMPIKETLSAALAAYRHPRLKAWLIIGNNWMARMIEGTLSSITGRKNVFWFTTETEALAHLVESQGNPSDSDRLLNCWESKQCGRGPNDANSGDLGVCPAASHTASNGVNHGTNGGRFCWAIAGTLCGGEVQATFARKMGNCRICPFFLMVKKQEGATFADTPVQFT